MENNQNLQNELKEIKSEIQRLQTRVAHIENQLNIEQQTIFQTTVQQPVEQQYQPQNTNSIFDIPTQTQQPVQNFIPQQKPIKEKTKDCCT